MSRPLNTSSSSDHPAVAGPRTRDIRIEVAAVTAVTVAVLVVYLRFLRPPFLSDQLDYFSSAAALPDVTPTHRHLRIGLLAPVRLMIELFGYSELAYYAVPFLVLAALFVGTYVLARLATGPWAAVSAALLVTLNPYVTWDATHLLPDLPGTVLFLWAVIALVLSSRTPPEGRSALILTALAGVLFGWSYLTRENLALFFPLVPAIFWVCSIPWRRLPLLAGSAASIFGVELIYGWLTYGDPLVRLRSAGSPRTTTREFATEVGDVLMILPDQFLSRSGGLIWLGLSVLALGPLLTGRRSSPRDRMRLLVSGWTASVWIVLTVIALLPLLALGEDRVLLRLHKVRYWFPIFPPLIIAGVATASMLLLQLGRRLGFREHKPWHHLHGAVLIGFAVITSAVGLGDIAASGAWTRTGSNEYSEIREFLQRSSDVDTIWLVGGAGRGSDLFLPMYTRTWYGRSLWQGELRAINPGGDWLDESEIQDGVLLHYPFSWAWFTRSEPGPRYLAQWPAHWTPVFVSSNSQLGFLDVGSSTVPTRTVPSGDPWQVLDGPDDVQVETSSTGFQSGPTDNDRMRLVDGRAERLKPPASTSRSPEGDLVRATLEIQGTADSNIELHCLFFNEKGDRQRVRALWFDDADGQVVDAACRRPPDIDTRKVRLMVYVSSATETSVEEVSLSWVEHAAPKARVDE